MTILADDTLKKRIQDYAHELGFVACGFARAQPVEKKHVRHFESWLNKGHAGTMHPWIARHFDKRVDPTVLVPGSKTIIVLLESYAQKNSATGPVARYARGKDYHRIFKDRLFLLLAAIRRWNPNVKGRAFTDSAPVMEHYWAEKSGVGWIGKHSLLLNRHAGSLFFIGSLMVEVDLEEDRSTTAHCGSCRRCIDACPTDAIVSPGQVDARKCISYLTIEYRDAFDSAQKSALNGLVFGCDICQDVCPWNTKNSFERSTDYDCTMPGKLEDESELRDFLSRDADWFSTHFSKTPLARAGKDGLDRNINARLAWLATKTK